MKVKDRKNASFVMSRPSKIIFSSKDIPTEQEIKDKHYSPDLEALLLKRRLKLKSS